MTPTPGEVRPRPLPFGEGGEGPVLLVLPGFAMGPETYRPVIESCAGFAHTVVADVYPEGPWRADEVIARLESVLLGELGDEPVTVLGHSFGGAMAVELVARHPGRVADLVIADSIGFDRRMRLNLDAATGFHPGRMITWRSVASFARRFGGRPVTMARAGVWAWASDPSDRIEAIAASTVRTHVVWAERDTFLPRRHGRDFAERLAADFHVVSLPGADGPLDHGWVFRNPQLVPAVLAHLGVAAGRGAPPGPPPVITAD